MDLSSTAKNPLGDFNVHIPFIKQYRLVWTHRRINGSYGRRERSSIHETYICFAANLGERDIIWITCCLQYEENQSIICHLADCEAAAITSFQLTERFQAQDETKKLVQQMCKFRFMDRLTALALLGKACHCYADRRELTGPDGRPVEALSGIKVEFVDASPAR